MAFPTTFPRQALAEILSDQKPANSVVALAFYDLLGFALYKLFGTTGYPVGSLNLSQVEDFLNLPIVKDLSSALSDYQTLKASGLSHGEVALQLILKYGPDLVESIK